MLTKLLKYEVKATGRIFLPLYLALAALAIITKLLFFIVVPDMSLSSMGINLSAIPSSISFFLYVCLSVALIVMTLIVVIQRFYKNILSDEGYLMFTLPVKTWQLILSKLMIALMWTFVCVLLMMLNIIILSADSISFIEISQEFSKLSTEFYTLFGFGVGRLIVEIIFLGFVGFISSILMIYVSIAIGQLFSKNRILASFGVYVLINVALQIILMTILVMFANMSFETLTTNQDAMKMLELILNSSTFFYLVFSVAFYFATQWILKKRLNLE